MDNGLLRRRLLRGTGRDVNNRGLRHKHTLVKQLDILGVFVSGWSAGNCRTHNHLADSTSGTQND